MIIKARHHKFIYPFFQKFSLWLIRRNFKEVITDGLFIDRNLPVLLISNHMSWHDGFWAMFLNVKVLKRKFHFMMLENQLRKHWYFNYTGGFSVKKSNRSIIESLKYASEILSDPGNMVLMYPQGRIQSSYTRDFIFEKGINTIIRNLNGGLQIIFMANLTDYFSDRKPGLYMYYQEYQNKDASAEALQKAYNDFYLACIEKQLQIEN